MCAHKCAGEVLALAVAYLRLAEPVTKVHLIDYAKAFRLAYAHIVAQQCRGAEILRYDISIVDVEGVLARQHNVGTIQLSAHSAVGKSATKSQIVLHHIAQHWAQLEVVVVAIDVFHHEKLVVVVFTLRIVGT